MDINVLEEFITICDTLSFQETAFRLNVSQSALTKHIHKLEEELGVSLFDRSTRSVKLNDFSHTYYAYAEQIVRTAKEGAAMMNRLAKRDESNLTLAFSSTCNQYGIVELISEFTKKYPQYNVQIIEGFRICDMILGNQCDFAFANDAIQIDERLSKVIYKVDHLMIYVRREDELAKKGVISLRDLEGKTMIAHSRSMGAYHMDTLNFQAACRKEGFSPEFKSSISFTSTIMKLVKSGQGIAALYCGQIPEEQLDPEIIGVDIDPQIESKVYLLYDSKHKKTAARRAFLNYLLNGE